MESNWTLPQLDWGGFDTIVVGSRKLDEPGTLLWLPVPWDGYIWFRKQTGTVYGDFNRWVFVGDWELAIAELEFYCGPRY